MICFFLSPLNLAIPLTIKLLDSVAPDVKMMSFASAPIKSATFWTERSAESRFVSETFPFEARPDEGRERKREKERERAYLSRLIDSTLGLPTVSVRPRMGVAVLVGEEGEHLVEDSGIRRSSSLMNGNQRGIKVVSSLLVEWVKGKKRPGEDKTYLHVKVYRSLGQVVLVPQFDLEPELICTPAITSRQPTQTTTRSAPSLIQTRPEGWSEETLALFRPKEGNLPGPGVNSNSSISCMSIPMASPLDSIWGFGWTAEEEEEEAAAAASVEVGEAKWRTAAALAVLATDGLAVRELEARQVVRALRNMMDEWMVEVGDFDGEPRKGRGIREKGEGEWHVTDRRWSLLTVSTTQQTASFLVTILAGRKTTRCKTGSNKRINQNPIQSAPSRPFLRVSRSVSIA
jgi:hypothetical protein